MIFSLAWKSLWNRRFTSSLTIVSIGLSIALLIGVERIRLGARDSFTNTISQTDLIVGARGGSLQLLLYSVFQMGTATNNVSWETYQHYSNHPAVAWTIPYSLGDSHRGFRVVGTEPSFYEHYRYRRDKKVELKNGKPSADIFDVVLGAEVADKLGYSLGEKLVLTHGISPDGVALQTHADKPFTVTGILKRTGTPIDRSLYITLYGMEAIHMDWTDGGPPLEGQGVDPNSLNKANMQIEQITSFFLGTKSRMETLQLQREINEYQDEAMMAIIPGVAISDLWDGLSYAENGLKIISAFVVAVGLLGMLISIYNSLNERRREMAILRSVGAGPFIIFALLVLESVLLTLLGIISGVGVMYLLFFASQSIVESQFGLHLPLAAPSITEWTYLSLVLALGLVLGAVPAIRAYRNTLADGLTIRI
jgi:putative ABC transport system permease protein